MWQYGVKVIVTAVIVVGISEAAKRWTLLGAVIASLPLTSILAMVWLYLDTRDVQKVSELSSGILWAILPSLVFFVLFPVFIKLGWRFWPSLVSAAVVTVVSYGVYFQVLSRLGVVTET